MQVAEYLDHERSNNPALAKCVRVCRQWQPVFERRIYNKVRVYSEEVQEERRSYNRVSFPQFQTLVSNEHKYRRSFVRKVEYTVITPYEIPTYQATKRAGYSEKNPIREANYYAFRAHLREFFEFLTSWDGPRLTVALGVKGREETQEPKTNTHKSVWEWQNDFYGDRVVLLYGAQFPGGVTMLPEVSCVEHLEFDHTAYDIWIGTIMQIAECCVALKRLDVDTMYHVRPDHLDLCASADKVCLQSTSTLSLSSCPLASNMAHSAGIGTCKASKIPRGLQMRGSEGMALVKHTPCAGPSARQQRDRRLVCQYSQSLLQAERTTSEQHVCGYGPSISIRRQRYTQT
jgi:hypothetical protein